MIDGARKTLLSWIMTSQIVHLTGVELLLLTKEARPRRIRTLV